MWASAQAQRQGQITKVFEHLQLPFEQLGDQWLVKIDHINVFCEDRNRYIRFSGDPDIGFPSGYFPHAILAQLLTRNSEVLAGAWQLDAAGGYIWCNFGMAIRYDNFKVPVVKESLELLLAETHCVATRYRHLRVI